MNSDEAIVRVLTEIRDNQQAETVWRKQVMEQSMRMQRSGPRGQRFSLIFGAVLIVGAILFAL